MSVQIDFKCAIGHLINAPVSAPTITAFLPEDAAEGYAGDIGMYDGDECDVTVFAPDGTRHWLTVSAEVPEAKYEVTKVAQPETTK